MPTRLQHLHALREHLNGVLSAGEASPSSARRIGLSIEAARDLRWLQQLARVGSDPRELPLTLAFGDDCVGREMPRRLRSPLDGSPIPVRSVRGALAGQAHRPPTWVEVRNNSHPADPPMFGTLGAILRSTENPARLFALTAGHVVGASPDSRNGDAVTLTFGTEMMVCRFFDCRPNFARLPVDTGIDAALMQIEASELGPFAQLQDDWPRSWTDPFATQQLHLRTRGNVFTGGSAQYMSCRMAVDAAQTMTYMVIDGLCWSAAPGFQGGDSGAPIWSAEDELIGIHTGATPQGSGALNAVAIPIGRILRWADADVVSRGESLTRTAVPRTGGALLGPPQPIAGPAAPAPGAPPASLAEPLGSDVDTLARTMWGEARGELDPAAGMGAVAQVVFNRVARQTYWGKDIVSVCRKPFQFSCWNANDPNLPQLRSVGPANPRFALALDIAKKLKAMTGAQRAASDQTVGATHYHTRQLNPPPRWARGHIPCARIGNHLFYSDIA